MSPLSEARHDLSSARRVRCALQSSHFRAPCVCLHREQYVLARMCVPALATICAGTHVCACTGNTAATSTMETHMVLHMGCVLMKRTWCCIWCCTWCCIWCWYQLGPLPPAVCVFAGRMHRVTCVQDVASAGAVLCLRKESLCILALLPRSFSWPASLNS